MPMLDRFKVPLKDQVRVPHTSLRATVKALFEKMGVSGEDADQAADTLVTTDLRGVETHGVSNMLRAYVQGYTSGRINPRPQWKVLRETPSTATIDCDKGLGIIMAPKAMRMAMDKARKVGVGVVVMNNGGHLGACGYHAMLAAQEGMVGMCATTGGLALVPTWGAEPRLGINAMAIAAPAKNEPFFLFDAATTTIAGNKVQLAKRVGAKLHPGWIADENGVPIMKEVDPPDRGRLFLLPLGSTREMGSHKGYGLAMMVETLCTILSGALPTVLEPNSGAKHFVAAYNISAFVDLEQFKENMDRTLRMLRETKPAPGHDRVVYPGLLEHEEVQERMAHGIPLHKEVVQWFDGICEELAIPKLQRL